MWTGFGDNHKGLLCVLSSSDCRKIHELDAIPPEPVIQIVSNKIATVFLTKNGLLYSVELGSSYSDVFLKKFNTEKVESLSAGNAHFLAKTKINNVYSWGQGTLGQLGQGNMDNLTEPTLIPFFNDKHVESCSAIYSSSFVLLSNKELYSFGHGHNGELANGSTSEINTPLPIQEEVTQLFGGIGHHFFARYDNGEIRCWGKNDKGQLGVGNKKNRYEPVKNKFLTKKNLCHIIVGGEVTLAITKKGELYTCGIGRNNGQPKMLTSFKINKYFKKMKIVNGSVGDNFAIVLTDIGELYGFGKKMEGFGQKTDIVKIPIDLTPRTKVLQMESGFCYSCYLQIENTSLNVVPKSENDVRIIEMNKSRYEPILQISEERKNGGNLKLTEEERKNAILRLSNLTKKSGNN
ncbi:hypothetical protein M0813_02618 [Anaeramoeba flamelloides]|uniref:Uncharacterized protein n=1 Tax=Anaeramoeba flamelloides TaxID=1746091 RepID=A0ABQ8YE16_9EUKA|nr:hypothetical protein M0813_02618 [Anaeramoeba flamelloides]